MYKLLVGLMLIATLSQLRIPWSDFENCHGRGCILMLQKASLDVLKIDWKPIVVLPQEAKRWKEIEKKAMAEEAQRSH